MIQYTHDHENEITLFAETNFRNERRRFGIKTDDRRRHVYIIGKTGMGKTTLLENMILADIYAGHGCCYIDPHGDTAEKILDFIPSHRINDVVYFNPADIDYPMGFNILETENDEQKPLIASGLMGVFKKIWPDVWSPRMEYILMNCVLALLDYPGATLLGINRLLVDKEYRARVIAKMRDPIVKTFWVAEFTSWSEKYATEAIAPVQNKVGQFLSSSVIRNIVAQVKSTLNLRRIMDDGKILIVNLSKGRIGEDNMRLLGGMLITKLQLAAQERQNIPKEEDRRDFYLFVDEFQNFANESFANILSEARKYRLNLIVAHQYIEQLDEKVTPAIFGNVGTIITFRVGSADAEAMEVEFAPTFLPEDLVNIAKFQIYLKLMVDGVSTPPFSANSLPPIAQRTSSVSKVVAVSRERYAESRPVIEAKVLQWSGMEAAGMPKATMPGDEAAETVVLNGSTITQYPAIKTEEEREQESVLKDIEPLEQAAEEGEEYLKITPERMAAITASRPQGGKKDKPQFPHTCTRCGKVWNLAIQLDPTRPMYCPECRPIVAEERKNRSSQVRDYMREPLPPETGGDVDLAKMISDNKDQSRVPNRPRIIRSDKSGSTPSTQAQPRGLEGEDHKKRRRRKKKRPGEGFVDELARTKGGPIEMRKEHLIDREPQGEPIDLSFQDEPPPQIPSQKGDDDGQPLAPGKRIKF